MSDNIQTNTTGQPSAIRQTKPLTESEIVIYFYNQYRKYAGVRTIVHPHIRTFVLVKRETGANPVRTRHRNQEATADISLGNREDGPREDL